MKIPKLKCKRCGHSWIPRAEKPPKVCPGCNSPYWYKDYSRSDKIREDKKNKEVGDLTEMAYYGPNKNTIQKNK